MNLLLLHPSDQLTNGHWRISGRRAVHIRQVLGLSIGATLRAGLLNQQLGQARLLSDDGEHISVSFEPQSDAPAALPLTLILALPRPKMLKRIFIDAASLGIKKIILLNSWKVEKSYWHTPELHTELLQEKLILGLEQSGDTQLPSVQLERRFKPFVEDQLSTIIADSRAVLAHPGDYPDMPSALTEPVTLAIGPEGGWTDYEVGLLQEYGFQCHRFGQRILRVETTLPTLVGRLMQLP